MSVPCEAGCGQSFQRQSSMNCHLSSSQSCQWYLSEKLKTLDEEEDKDNIVFPPQDTDYGGVFDEEDDLTTNDVTNLHSIISQLIWDLKTLSLSRI